MATEHDISVLPVHSNPTDEATVERVTAEIRERFGRIDIFVNKAGGDIGAAGVGARTRASRS